MDQLNAAIDANTSVADFALALADAAIAAPKAEAPAAAEAGPPRLRLVALSASPH
jgi:hypothetical protein